MKKKSIIKSIFSETNTDEWSHKRVIGVVGALSLIFLMIACSIWDLTPPPATLVGAVEMLSIACVAGTAIEKFSNYRKNIHPNQQQFSDQLPTGQFEQQEFKNNYPKTSQNIEENEN